MRPYFLRYISRALALLSSAAHWMVSRGVPTSAALGNSRKYFTSRIRDVLSARSSERPRRRKCQASPRDMVDSAIPSSSDPPSLIWPKNSNGEGPRRPTSAARSRTIR